MYDIDETDAATVDWNEAVQGFEETDLVQGGVGGVDNIPLSLLALRTKNLHLRMADAEGKVFGLGGGTVETLPQLVSIFAGWDPGDELEPMVSGLSSAVAGLILDKANKTGNNITDAATWLNKLGITHKVIRSGVSPDTYVSSGTNVLTVYLPSSFVFDPAKHRILLTVEHVDAYADLSVCLDGYPSAGVLSSFPARVRSFIPGSIICRVHYIITEKL
ncbi:MAG: hypothetical protein KF872_05895 [Chitinophagales bacterium]|nr:hypothetical protein [Chitinophagales bacterium]